MKKTTLKGVAWILALGVLAGVFSGCSAFKKLKGPEASKDGVRDRRSYGEDGQITDQKLNRYEYSVSGDMEGSYYKLIIEQYDENHALYTEKKTPSHMQDIDETVYLVDAGILEDLQMVFNENNMKLWDNKNDFTEEFIYDGASYSYYFQFDIYKVGFSSQSYDEPYDSGIAQIHRVIASYEENMEAIAEPEGIPFREFSGDYFFSSGSGGWSTDVTIYEDGSFSGVFHDSDMGVTGEGYPNGTVYLCEFSGKFSELEKKDDFTYTCSLEEITQEEEAGIERISQEDGIKYIYSDPYGFDGGKEFEFYLPGKSVADFSSEFLSWMSAIRYNEPYPDTLFNRAFNNVSNMYGFEEYIESSQDVVANYPASLPLSGHDLSGSYINQNLDINLAIECGDGDGICGMIFWDIPEKFCVGNRMEVCSTSDNGFDAKTEIYGGEYRTSYKIIVTDNTKDEVVIHLYDNRGRDCGEYVMIEHFGI